MITLSIWMGKKSGKLYDIKNIKSFVRCIRKMLD